MLTIAAHRHDQGNYPDTLAALMSKYIERLPRDAFDDRQFFYRLEGNGFVLYTAGPNGKDEGGWEPLYGPSNDDWTIRMPVPVEESN